MSRQWVSKYDEEPTQKHAPKKMPQRGIFPVKSNVWGLEEGKIKRGDSDQPDSQFHHGATPSFVVQNLVDLYKPKKVLDSMAGVGTTKHDQGKTRDTIAKYVGVSGRTLEKTEKIVEAYEKDPERFGQLMKNVDSGKICRT